MAYLPSYIRRAIRCGPVPKLRNWRELKLKKLTRAERVMAFGERYLITPEGDRAGKPLRLDVFQQAFIYAVFDSPTQISRAFLSIARKNGKTSLIALIVAAFVIGPEAKPNSRIVSGARSHKQAAEVFGYLKKMIVNSPKANALVHIRSHLNEVVGLGKNVTYKALTASPKTNLGGSPRVAVLDELGAIDGSTDAFVDAIDTAQGAYSDALLIGISTQAKSDLDLFSLWLDDAERSLPSNTVSHVYEAEADCDIMSKTAWRASNPALGVFRSEVDQQAHAELALRMPSRESSFRNFNLNQRIALEGLWLAPTPWRNCSGAPDLDVLRRGPVALGLDLSSRDDLTAAVASAVDDDGVVHALPFTYTPAGTLEDRAKRDRVPYEVWVRDGQLFALPGNYLDYDDVCTHVALQLSELGIDIDSIEFDPWRIDVLMRSAERTGFAQLATWNRVGQGYKSMSPRCEAFQRLILQGMYRHGGHPLLNMAASHAVAMPDPAGNVKLAKDRSSHRIDPLVAAVMAAYPVTEGEVAPEFDVQAMIG